MSQQSNVAVLGTGAWGSALACVAARAGNSVAIWGRSSRTVDEINRLHTNPNYLNDLQLDHEVLASTNLESVIKNADLLIMAVPAQTIGAVSKLISKHLVVGTPVVSAAKGIDRSSGLAPTSLIQSVIPSCNVSALSGPGFAHDVVKNLPTAVTVACKDIEIAKVLAAKLSSRNFRCYASSDVVGVELGGALKNVLALAVGAARGMQLGASAEAALIARGFSEISRIASKLGADPATLAGLSGMGDIVLSCSNEQSRNFRFGIAMGKGESLTGLKLAEGAFTAKIAETIAKTEDVNSPIISAVNAVLDGRLTAREAVADLLDRPLKTEN